ncbi:MAG: hypothetical protein NVS4B13_03700 [Candidatus Elarobacter sp.]
MTRSGSVRVAFVAAVCVGTLVARPCFGSEPGYVVWFAGQVLSVDAHRGRVRIARGPTETSGRGIEDFVAASTALKLVRPGMQIEAEADTRRRPWKILRLRVMEHKKMRPQNATPTPASL